MDKINVVFIKYKFIFNKDIKHTSYTYQKVFRDIYGYNQNVTKNNNKVYKYFRKGIIYNIPYIKPGKNAIILPIGFEQELIKYFDSIKDISDKYTLTYSINKIDINKESVIQSFEKFINEFEIINLDNKNNLLIKELDYIINNNINNKNYLLYIIKQCEYIINLNWFDDIKDQSELITSFYNKYNIIKEKINLI